MNKRVLLFLFFLSFSLLNQAQTLNLVKDLNPGTGDGFDQWNNKAISYNNLLIFAAQNEDNDLELYSLNAGVLTLVKDINDGTDGSNPANFILYNNKVYFTAYDAIHGEEVWSTDGTAAGTVLAVEAIPGSDPASGSGPGILISAKNNKLYFSVEGDVYTSDGTTAGTSMVPGLGFVDFNEDFSDASPRVTTYGNGIAFFSKNGADVSIYALDVSAPVLLKTVTYDQYSTTDTYGISEVSAGLLFASYNSFYDQYNGLFTINKSDGSLTEIKDASNASIDVNRVLHFNGNKVLFKMTTGGIYSTDGTQAGTIQITPATYTLSQGEHIPNVVINNTIVFYGDDASFNTKVYQSDGTVAGTSIIGSCQPYLSNFISDGNNVYWSDGIVNYFNSQIWSADITKKTSSILYTFAEESSYEDGVNMIGIQNSKVYLASTLKGDGRELYTLTPANASLGIISAYNNTSQAYKLCTLNPNDGSYSIYSESSSETLEIMQYDLTGNLLYKNTVHGNEAFVVNTKTPMSLIKVTGSNGTASYKIISN